MAKPNYSNPQTRPPAIQATAIVYILLGVLSLGLRLYTRGYIKRLFGTDDAFMIASTVFAVAMYTAALIASLCFGVNRHTVDIPPAMLYKLEKTNYIYNFLFVEATYMSKLSLLWFSWRLVGNALNYGFDLRRLALGFLFVFAVVSDITYIVVALLGCRYALANLRSCLTASHVLTTAAPSRPPGTRLSTTRTNASTLVFS